jgi:hypothetical protein
LTAWVLVVASWWLVVVVKGLFLGSSVLFGGDDLRLEMFLRLRRINMTFGACWLRVWYFGFVFLAVCCYVWGVELFTTWVGRVV